MEHTIAIYGGSIAALFAGIGIWLGLTITRKEAVVVVKEVPVLADGPFTVNAAKVRELAITPRELEILQLIANGMSRPRDRRRAVCERKHGENARWPVIRQARCEPPDQGGAARQGPRPDSLNAITQTHDSSRPIAKSSKGMTTRDEPTRTLRPGHGRICTHLFIGVPMSMKKTVLTFGLLSGAVSSMMMLVTSLFLERIGFDRGEMLGYTTIVLSFLLVFFGIRSYREQVDDNVLTFGRAFTVGILITLISCVCYVMTWEVIYFKIIPRFGEEYAAYMVDYVRASGASPSVIDATVRDAQRFKAMQDNLLMNAATTFAEPFPIGLVMTAVSAGVLRRKRSGT